MGKVSIGELPVDDKNTVFTAIVAEIFDFFAIELHHVDDVGLLRGLVVLDGEGVVAAARDDHLHGLRLAVKGVTCDHGVL